MNSGIGPVVAVLSDDLQLVLVSPHLAHLLASGDEPLEGRNLLELVPRGRARELLSLVTKRVARRASFEAPGAPDVMLTLRVLVSPSGVMLHLHADSPGADTARPLRHDVVGRACELNELESFLADDQAQMLHVVGPLGIGKSALLRRFAALLREHQCPHAFVDAHTLGKGGAPVSPAAPALDAALLTARNLAAEGHERMRRVLLLDNADALDSADTFEPFLRAPLPWRVVTASRRLPECDAWRSLGVNARMIRLGPLAREEAIALALASGVDRAEADRVVRRAQGHPTLLTMSTCGRDAAFRLELELSHQRDFLEAGAAPARVTEDVLAALLETRELAARAYSFLAEVCIPAADGFGLRMPGPFRDSVLGRLGERSPQKLSASWERLAAHYGDVLDAGNGNSLQASADDFLDAFAGMPAFAPLIEPSSESTVRIFEASRADADRITRALAKFGRIHSTTDVLRRLEHPFYRTWFAHDGKEGDGLLQCALGSLGQMVAATGDTDDGMVRDGVTALQRGGRYSYGDAGMMVVFAAAVDSGKGWGPVSRALFRHWFRRLFTLTRGAFGAFVIDQKEDVVRFPPFSIRPTEVASVGTRRIILRDLRGTTRRKLFVEMVRGTSEPPTSAGPASTFPITTELVRLAFEYLADPARLAESPLVSLRVVENEAGPDPRSHDRAAALARVMRRLVSSVEGDPKTREVLVAAFVQREKKHEAIAHELSMPYGTFRRHLGRAVERVADALRRLEADACEPGGMGL